MRMERRLETAGWLTDFTIRLAAAIAAIAIIAPAFAAPAAPTFHHLLVRAPQDPVRMRDYYYGLFESAGVRQEMVDAVAGVASADAHLLFTGQPPSRDRPFAVWHFGWGSLVLDEPYSQHYLKEVEWKDARVSLVDRFHLHLNSADPQAAANWYATAFGAEVVLGDSAVTPMGSDDVKRRAEAFVKLGEVALAFYRTSDQLVCSTGQRVDHLGVLADPARAAKAPRPSHLCQSIEPAPDFHPAAAIEGPDGLVIEVIDRATI